MASISRAVGGHRAIKCKFHALVHEITTLPAPTPPKGFVEVYRTSKSREVTKQTTITGTCMAVWEEELVLSITMYMDSNNNFTEKEVKFSCKDATTGKSICSLRVNIAEHLKGWDERASLQLLLVPKKRSFFGTKEKPCPMKVTFWVESPPEVKVVPGEGGVAGSPSTNPFDVVDTNEYCSDVSEMDCADSDMEDDESYGSSAFGAAPAPAPTGPGIKRGKHRRANSEAGGGALSSGIVKPTNLRKTHSDPETFGARSRQGSMNGGPDPDDLMMEIDVLKMKVEEAERMARDEQRDGHESKRLFQQQLRDERAKHQEELERVERDAEERIELANGSPSREKAEIERLKQEVEALKQQVTGLQSALDVAFSSEAQSSSGGMSAGFGTSEGEQVEELKERVNYLETELIHNKMRMAELEDENSDLKAMQD